MTLLAAGLLGESSDPSVAALLCDSLYPEPFLVTCEQTVQLLQASAVDAATSLSDFSSDFGCFLVGHRL